MNNQTPFGQRDEASLPDGDLTFNGVEERTVYSPAGFVNRAVNCRFRTLRAATRDGITLLPWGPSGGLGKWTDVYGGFVFADPNGVTQYFVIAADNAVWMTRPNASAIEIPLPAGVSLTRATFKKFIQANASIIMLRGFSANGNTLRPLRLTTTVDGDPDWATGFQAIVQENEWSTVLRADTNQVSLVQHNLSVGDPVQFTSADSVRVVVVSSLQRLGATATATSAGHRLAVGMVVTIAGATPGAYNGTATVTAVTANTFQYQLAADPGVNATGSITATTVPLPAALTSGQTYYVREVQNANLFTIASTPGGTALTWNTSATDTSSYTVTMTVLDGAVPIPEAVDGIFTQNRLFLIDGKDTVAVSDIGDFTRYQPATQEFRINAGDAYTLRALWLFNESTLLCFKNGHVRKVAGVTGDLSGAAGPLNVTQAYGMAAASVADIGNDVYWLSSELRVTSLSLTVTNNEQGTNAALSDPLQYSFARINPGRASQARLAVFDGYLHVALPLDDARIIDTSTNLVPAGTVFTTISGLVAVQIPVTAGQKYAWQAGSTDALLFDQGNGAGYQTDTVFTAAGSTLEIIAILGTAAGAPCGSVLQRVVASDCNTAVAVYDFQKQAWAGTDEALMTCVVDWLKFDYNGKQKLAFIGADGYLHLYYEGYEDEQMSAGDLYVDMFLNQANPFAWGNAYDSLQINGGTTVTQAWSATNSGTVWGMALNGAGANLWQDANGKGGYNPAATTPWSAPNCTPLPIADGLRLVPTNGTLPTIKINGTVVATGTGKVTGTAGLQSYYFDWHHGTAIASVPVASRILTRAYPCKSWSDYAAVYTTGGRPGAKRFTTLALQVATWAPSYSITTYTNGANNAEAYVTGETRNYLHYVQPYGAADWDPGNAADDFGNPHRADYAYPETGAGLFLGNGVNFDQLQEFAHRVPIDENALHVQAEIVNDSGRLELVMIASEAQTQESLSGPN